MAAIGRVTQTMLTDRSLTRLQGSLSRLGEIQEQLSTGRVLNRASDNPADASSAMRLRSSIGAQQQYVRNAQDGVGWLDALDSSLGSAGDLVRRARELGQQAISGAAGPEAREALATEIDQVRKSLVTSANVRYLDRPVFGGSTTGSAAFTESGGTVTFAGDANPVNRAVADGVLVDVSVAGPVAFGPDGDSVFDHLGALSAALRAGDLTAVRTGLDALEVDGKRITVARADVGARTNRVEQAGTRASDAELSLTNALSEIENADLPRTTVALQMQEVAYQAALAATSRVLQPSLMDFLR
ncbi:flagellar hook-associated protein 3 [Nocardioides oleivorans]|uniref:Flagellar hook-associated protein 3 n=1 Tax=Nocardioides oleivorans TaxID=273676 RepID=A0A4Q2RY63_9ACTN|nr:flagellar hook-associated protein FlgL [Nocardioides oleivorans]RYB94221.1 flagellar hook-associated protein 3 [Nocardioides oleivorans]